VLKRDRFGRLIAQLGCKSLSDRIVSAHRGHGGALAVLDGAPMNNARFVFNVAAALSIALAAPTSAQTRTAAAPYEAVTDRVTYPKPALPALGPAGSAFGDPIFQSRIVRITDAATRPGVLNRSYRTPSSPHQNSWSARSSYFYVMGSGGAGPIPFAFDASTGTARRIQPSGSGDGGLVLDFYIEPQFSYVDDGIIYGSYNGAASTRRTIDQYDFGTGAYTTLLNLDSIVSGLGDTYIGGLASSGGPTERIMAFFGGTAQDRHHLVLVFDKANPANRLLLDTFANTINGAPASIPLNFSLHHAAMDRSGRYIMLYPTGVDQSGARRAPQSVAWDTQTGVLTEMPVSTLPYGHDAFGYGVSVNQDCCVNTDWDAAQWQFRNLATPTITRDLLPTPLSPKEVYLEDHTTWNNARPDRLVPVISGLFRYGTSSAAWRALDDEIVAIQTDAPGRNPAIWRFAHHRSNVAYDGDASRVAFWYEPRPNVSQDGRWVLFTSNWEKTLGTDSAAEAGTSARQDVFLLELKQTGSTSPLSSPQMTIDMPGPNATLTQPFTVAGWALDAGAAADSGMDAVHVYAFPNPGSGQAPVFLGVANYGRARGDVARLFGPQFLASGYDLAVNGLEGGTYLVAAIAHSRISGQFNTVRTVTISVAAPHRQQPRMSIDIPGNGGNAGRTFAIAGWAIDPNTAAGSGVDTIHVWASPNPGSGAAPVFVGVAALGFARPDVAQLFGPSGAASGYGLIATLPPGVYDIIVFAHSSVTDTFNNALSVRITVR
jgi:hypothetical protein